MISLRLQGRETHGLIPVTLKQISEAYHSGEEKSNFVINGVEAANVLLFIVCKSLCVFYCPSILGFLTSACFRLLLLEWCLTKLREILTSPFTSMMEQDESNAEDGKFLLLLLLLCKFISLKD